MDERDTLNVPYDIVRNILVRLPVKSLLRFKAVSTTYLTIISDPVFIRAHLRQSKNSMRQNIFIEEYPDVYGEARLIKIDNQICQVESVLKYPMKEYGPFSLLCSCDGLSIFLCSDYCRPRGSTKMLFMLFNPSSNTFQLFLCPYKFDRSMLSYGLCYDPLIEDYKFIVTDMSHHHAVLHCRNNYSIEKKELLFDEAFHANSLIFSREGICFDGALYWLLDNFYLNQCEIVCFDLRDDKYKVMHKPKDLQENGVRDLALLGGHLCLSGKMDYNSMMQIFRLNKDGNQDTWIKFIAVNLSSVPWSFKYATPRLLTNENVIILYDIEDILAAYDPSKKTFAEVQRKWNRLHYPPVPYIDNLFFSERNNIHGVTWGYM